MPTEISSNGQATSQVFSKMLRIQLLATLAVSAIALVLSGIHAAISACSGGIAVIVGAYVASKIAARSDSKKDASAILINLLKAEAVKIIIIITMLFITFKIYKQLVPFALIAGLAAAALFSGAAISKLNEDSLQIK